MLKPEKITYTSLFNLKHISRRRIFSPLEIIKMDLRFAWSATLFNELKTISFEALELCELMVIKSSPDNVDAFVILSPFNKHIPTQENAKCMLVISK